MSVAVRLADELHARAVRSRWLQLLAAVSRGLLAIGFVIPGLTKVRGIPFAPGIPTTEPIGAFFAAFFQAHGYYAFVGAAQVAAGLLLLHRATTLLGAMLYLPIIANIFVITVALHFTGTPVVAGLMLLAALFLVCWDFDRWRTVLPGFADHPSSPYPPDRHMGLGLVVAASGALGLPALAVMAIGRALLEHRSLVLAVPAAVALMAGGALGVRWVLAAHARDA